MLYNLLDIRDSFPYPPSTQKQVPINQDKGGMPKACAVSCRVKLWGCGMDAKSIIWNEPADVKTAAKLMEDCGPKGEGWCRFIEKPGENPPVNDACAVTAPSSGL